MKPNDSAFWQYKVYADILGGSLERGCQTRVGLSKTAIFNTFARYFFRRFRGKAKIVIQYYLVSHHLSTDPIICELAILHCHSEWHNVCLNHIIIIIIIIIITWMAILHNILSSFVYSGSKFAYLLIRIAPLYLWWDLRETTYIYACWKVVTCFSRRRPQCPVQINS